VVNSDLNRLLLKTYNFDVKANCESLKHLEQVIEKLVAQTTEDLLKKPVKAQQVLFSIYLIYRPDDLIFFRCPKITFFYLLLSRKILTKL
jgi:hypothetical protein